MQRGNVHVHRSEDLHREIVPRERHTEHDVLRANALIVHRPRGAQRRCQNGFRGVEKRNAPFRRGPLCADERPDDLTRLATRCGPSAPTVDRRLPTGQGGRHGHCGPPSGAAPYTIGIRKPTPLWSFGSRSRSGRQGYVDLGVDDIEHSGRVEGREPHRPRRALRAARRATPCRAVPHLRRIRRNVDFSDESGQLSSLSGLSTVGRFAINLALDGVDAESQCSWHLQTVLHGRRDRADL